ncbi:tetratricopeptide repeat protein [Geminocystis sp. CENA526]|uniref:tetratricopeptide repeat protein n=1 Tax=Geminocystis sp. CENA526 TaxID=1355871 RepID=UPI003D6EAD86
MTNQDKNNDNLTPSNQGKINKYSSDLIKKGLDLARSLEKPQETPESWRLKGNDFLHSGLFEEALKCYENAVKLDPNYSLAWNNKGTVFGRLEKYQEALNCYNKAVETDPTNDLAWKNRGKVLSQQFQCYEDAIYSYQQVLKINPDDSDSWLLLGRDWEKMRNFENALESYNQALQIKENDWRVWMACGLLHFQMNNYKEAILCFDNFIQLKPKDQNLISDVNIWQLHGSILYELQHYEEAISSFDKCLKYLERQPDTKIAGLAWFYKGQAFLDLRLYKNALICYDNALIYDPNDIVIWNNRGSILEEMENYQEAINSYQKALEIDPNYELTINNSLRLFEKLNEIIESQKDDLTKKNWKCIATSTYFKDRFLKYKFSDKYAVADLELSPNGKFLVAIDTRGLLCIWNLEEKRKVKDIDFSIKDKIQNLINNQPYCYFKDRFYYSYKKKFNYVQECYLEKLLDKSKISDLSFDQINEIIDLLGDQCYRLAISSDNNYLFGINGYSIKTWNLNSGELLSCIEKEYNDIAFNLHQYLAIIPSVYGLSVWNLLTGKIEKKLNINSQFENHLCYTNFLQLSEDENYISCNFSIFLDNILKVTECISGEFELGLLSTKGQNFVSFINFIKSQSFKSLKELALDHLFNYLKLSEVIITWDINTGELLFVKENKTKFSGGNSLFVNIHSNRKQVLNGFSSKSSSYSLQIINAQSSEIINSINISAPAVNFEIKLLDELIFIFDNDKRKSTDGVYIYNFKNNDIQFQLDSNTDIFSNNIIDKETKSIIVGCADSTIKIWNYLTGDILSLNSHHNSYISTLSNLVCQNLFASSGDDRIIKLWKY